MQDIYDSVKWYLLKLFSHHKFEGFFIGLSFNFGGFLFHLCRNFPMSPGQHPSLKTLCLQGPLSGTGEEICTPAQEFTAPSGSNTQVIYKTSNSQSELIKSVIQDIMLSYMAISWLGSLSSESVANKCMLLAPAAW